MNVGKEITTIAWKIFRAIDKILHVFLFSRLILSQGSRFNIPSWLLISRHFPLILYSLCLSPGAHRRFTIKFQNLLFSKEKKLEADRTGWGAMSDCMQSKKKHMWIVFSLSVYFRFSHEPLRRNPLGMLLADKSETVRWNLQVIHYRSPPEHAPRENTQKSVNFMIKRLLVWKY